MLDCCLHPHQHHNAIFEKYGDKRYKRASHFVQAELDRGFTPQDVVSNHPAAFANVYDERQFCGY